MADPSQIGDALLNLALNARDAMPHGGGLTIETANLHLAGQRGVDGATIRDGDYVVLAVSDTGTGMPPEVVQHATEPFFTTKPPGTGSGLGLSMIYGFVGQSGGHLAIDSEMGVGTTVRLYLPRAGDDAATAQAAREAVVPEPGGDEAILLVDDNAILRDVTAAPPAGAGLQGEHRRQRAGGAGDAGVRRGVRSAVHRRGDAGHVGLRPGGGSAAGAARR